GRADRRRPYRRRPDRGRRPTRLAVPPSSLAAPTLAPLGVRELVIANRTLDRAERLAASLAEARPGTTTVRAVPMSAVTDELTRASAVISCTGATGLVLTADAVADALAVPEAASAVLAGAAVAEGALRAPDGSLVARLAETAGRDGRVRELGGRQLAEAPDGGCPVGLDDTHGVAGTAGDPAQHGVWVENATSSVPTVHQPRQPVRNGTGARGTVRMALLDLAMPRDIDHAVHRVPGARLVDIESLAEASADAPMAADVDQVRDIVAAEVAAFGAAQRAARITPTVVALRTMAADVVAHEMARLDGRLNGLDDKQRGEIRQTVHRVVDKLLHAPTVRVKQLASEPGGAGYADALRTLFDLDPETVASVSRADVNDRETDAENRGRS
ncbi:glutamyl-tRNA reductase, partial [Streptomyces sp. NPDC058953]